MEPLTRAEARAALRKGQGRVVLHLGEHGAAGLRDEILEACLHSLTYDPQCEGSRADWLLSLIDLTGDEDFYCERILEALPSSAEFWDVDQLLDLALAFARRGCTRARDALYRKFARQQFPEDWLGGQQIVALDGVAGMLHVAEVFGARRLDDPDFWVDDSLLAEACEQCGAEAVMAALHDRAQSSAGVRAYRDGIAALRATRQTATPSRRPTRTTDEILADIDSAAGEYPGHYIHFGRHASVEDLERVFERLLGESRRDQLLRCLWVFRRRVPPRLDGRLFALAESSDEQLQRAALAALAQSQDGGVRELGIRLLRDQPNAIARGAIALFQRNYVPGDQEVIESALFVPGNGEASHSIGFDILDFAGRQPDPELARCLEWVYEHTPCSNCRGKALEALRARERAPAGLLREAAWDCAEDTRSEARAALARE